MPQTNIVYNTPYNRTLVSQLKEMEQKGLNYNHHQYEPSPMGFRNAASFHEPRTVMPVQVKLTGGVAPSKYILNGNSPAYPPINMNAGMAVSSGGGRNAYAGVDGAIGGKFSFGNLAKGVKDATDVYKAVAPLLGGEHSGGVKSGGVKSGGKFSIGKALKSVGAVAKTGKEAYDIYKSVMGGGHAELTPADLKKLETFNRKLVSGGSFLSDAFNVVKQLAPIVAPLMMGAGRCKVCDKVEMVEKAMKKLQGGSFWKDFGRGFVKGFTGTLGIAKDILPVIAPLLKGAGRRSKKGGAVVGAYLGTDGQVHHGAAVKGGVNLKDAIAATKAFASKGVKEVVKRGKKALKAVATDLLDTAKSSVVREAKKAVSGGGRSARAAIVKKVMAEKGLKMIAASQYVKEHGLYKK